MKKFSNILFLIVWAGSSLGQAVDDDRRLWELTSISGEFRLKANYRNQNSMNAGIEDHQLSSQYGGGLLLRTSSYFLTKKFMILDIVGEYNPETSNDKYLVVPDRSEVRTLERLGMSTLLFQQKPVKLTLFAHFDKGYSNRENLTSLKTNYKDYGSTITFANKVLPAALSYKESTSEVQEIPGSNFYNINQKNFQGTMSRSFGSRNKNELIYSHDNYSSHQYDQVPVDIITENINLSNSFIFDQNQNFIFNSNISAFKQKRGETQQRFILTESFIARLPNNLNLQTNYSFYKYEWSQQKSDQHNISGRLSHTLLESLTTTVVGEYSATRHTLYHETIIKSGIDFLYHKTLPTKGLLTLNYRYERRFNNQVSNPLELQILNEQHILNDGNIVLLNKAYVNTSSIFVTDLTGNIIYQLNSDYLLIQRNGFVEIQRMPGGQIANNSGVLINYQSTQPGSYEYNLNSQYASARLMLFDQFVEFNYSYRKQSYSNLQNTDYLTMDSLYQHIYGTKVQYKFASAGVEYDDYHSTIIPYKMVHYFVTLQGSYNTKVTYNLTGNIRDYNMTSTQQQQLFNDLSGNISYNTNTGSQLNINIAYRYQAGAGIDLKLSTARVEYISKFRKIYYTVGLEFYKRKYIGENLNFLGANLSISRRF